MALASVWHSRSPSAEEMHDEVERLVNHPILHGSEALCNLLRYLAEKALGSPEQQLKEHQIATEVFGRPSTFDPRVDSTVRVQTSRLRSKLAEYYAASGSEDAWRVEIPKGSYTVVLRQRAASELPNVARTEIKEQGERRLTLFIAAIGGVVALAALIVSLTRPAAPPVTLALASDNSSIAQFWGSLTSNSEEPLVIFSNAEFVGRPETGMRYLQPGEKPPAVFDHYTGIGEVFAIHQIDSDFAALGRPYILKRGGLLSWDDTKGRDLVFVGSPSENLPLRDLPLDRDFVFRRQAGAPRPGDLGIVNLRPKLGERQVYFGSKEPPFTEDYAVIEVSATAGARHLVLLAGTTTFGTQGAVEFVSHRDTIASLMSRFAHAKPLPSFTALLHVRVQGGVPLDGDLIALRID